MREIGGTIVGYAERVGFLSFVCTTKNRKTLEVDHLTCSRPFEPENCYNQPHNTV